MLSQWGDRDAGGGGKVTNPRDESSTQNGQDGLRAPDLLAWLASLAAIGVIAANLLLPRGDNAYLRGGGVVALLLGAGFGFVPFVQLRKHGRAEDGQTYMATQAVADRGLYAVTRHPQYLGYMLLACGFGLLSQHWAALLLAAVTVVLFYRQAVEEERQCLDRLGEPYERYMRRVPRFNVFVGLARLVRRS